MSSLPAAMAVSLVAGYPFQMDIDLLALDFLRQSDRVMSNVQVLNCAYDSLIERRSPNGHVSSIRRKALLNLQRPNSVRVETSVMIREPNTGTWKRFLRWSSLHGNKEAVLSLDHRSRTYHQVAATPDGRNISLKMLSPLDGFFQKESRWTTRVDFLRSHGLLKSLREIGIRESEGEYCRGAVWTYRQIGTDELYREELWIGFDGLPREYKRASLDGKLKAMIKISSVNQAKPAATLFKLVCPKGYRSENLDLNQP